MSIELQMSPIARRAYEIYFERGALDGNDEVHWLLAERELKGRWELEDIFRKAMSVSYPTSRLVAGALEKP